MDVEVTSYVDKYISSPKISPIAVKKIRRFMDRLKDEGHVKLMAPKIVKKIKTKIELFELIIDTEKHYRILFFLHQNKYILIHGFDKGWGQPTPPKEIATAIARYKNYIQQ